MSIRTNCPECGSENFKKNGHTHNGKQNHQCKDCGSVDFGKDYKNIFGFLPADMIFFGKDLFQLTSLSLLLIKSNPKKISNY
jgi:hypothetical protein